MTLLEFLVKELPKRGGWLAIFRVFPDWNVAEKFISDFKVSYGTDSNCDQYIESEETGEIVTREQYEAAIAAQQPVWNGEGLPPVGLLVELMDDSHSQTWSDVTIKFYGDSFAVWDDHGEERSNSLCHVKVRTIRTEEDDIKREEAINAISLAYDTQDRFGNYRAATGVYEDIAAGKIPGVELSK